MALSQQRKRQIEDSARGLQSRVQKGETNLQEDLQNLQDKITQDTENPAQRVDLAPPIQTGIAQPTPTDADIEAGADPTSTPVDPSFSIEKQLSPEQVNVQRSKLQAQENAKLKEELSKQKNITTALGFNIESELADLRRSNTAFRSQLGAEIGLEGIDDDILSLENEFGLLVDRNELRTELTEIAEARQGGILDEEETAQSIQKLVLTKGRKVGDILKEQGKTPELPEEKEGEVPSPELAAAKRLTEQEIADAPFNNSSGALVDPKRGITTYEDIESGITYTSNPNEESIDTSKLSVEDLLKLDSAGLLKAELKMFGDALDQDDKENDAFFKLLTDSIEQNAILSRSIVESNAALATQDARLEAQKNQDAIFFRQQELAMERADTFEDIAEQQAKMEGYMKGKLSAMGASDSSAALAIQSANSIKFAKIKSRTAGKFSLEANRLTSLMSVSQQAFTNSIVQIQVNSSNNMAKVALNTTDSLLNLAGQKLKSDSQKRAEELKLNLGYVKGIRDIEANASQAKLDADKASRQWLKDRVGIEKTYSGITGTIWNMSEDGQMVDTKKPTFAASIATAKLDLAKLKAARSGAAGTGKGKEAKITDRDAVEAWIDFAFSQGLTVRQVNENASIRFKSNAAAFIQARATVSDILSGLTVPAPFGPLQEGIQRAEKNLFFQPVPPPTFEEVLAGGVLGQGGVVEPGATSEPGGGSTDIISEVEKAKQ